MLLNPPNRQPGAINRGGLRNARRGAVAPSLSAYYGTGMGQIPLHLLPDDAVLDGGGNVVSIANRGGAGAAFNMSVIGTGITRQSGLLNIASTSVQANLATPANMVGTRMFFVAQPSVSTNSYRYFGATGTAVRIGAGQVVLFRGGVPQTTGTIASGVPDIASPTLIEMELDGTAVRVWFNGVSVGSAGFAVADFQVDRLARGNSAGSEFTGLMGDVLSVITDSAPARDSTMLAVRQIVAAKHGIALS